MLNLSDYIIILLLWILSFSIFFAFKYSKNTLCFLSVLLWIIIWVLWEKFILSPEFKGSFWQKILDYIKNFFSDSIIIDFLLTNYKTIFFFLLFIASYKILYYLWIVLIYFSKWLWENFYLWLTNKKADFRKRRHKEE